MNSFRFSFFPCTLHEASSDRTLSQWIKKYFETNYGGHPYDAVERRGGAAVVTATAKENPTKVPVAAVAAAPKPKPAAAARVPARDVSNTAPPAAGRPSSASASGAAVALKDENRRLQEELTSLKFTVEKVGPLMFHCFG